MYERPGLSPGVCICVLELVLAQHPDDSSLYLYGSCGNDDWFHPRIRRLQSDFVAFAIQAFEGSISACDQRHNDVPVVSDLSLLNEHIIAIENVLILHGVAAYLEYEGIFRAGEVRQRDAFWSFYGFDWLAG